MKDTDPGTCPTLRLLVICADEGLSAALSEALAASFAVPVDLAPSCTRAAQLLALHGACYPVAVVALELPDAAEGEAIDLVTRAGIATIALTEVIDESVYQRIAFRPVVDYVDVTQPGAVLTIEQVLRRTLRNAERHVLLVDGSESFADYQAGLLRDQRLTVTVAHSRASALEALRCAPEICLVVVDNVLADGDGVAFCAELRGRHETGSFAILGISGAQDPFVAVRFLKAGADDILRKPFLVEEFASRVNGCLDRLDTVTQVRNQANRDYLTGLYNRRYLFEAGHGLFENARRDNLDLAVAVIDIDHFKRINDIYGHDVGDVALIAMAKVLAASFRTTDLVARLGGEEFCVLAVNPQAALVLMERLRSQAEAFEIPIPGSSELLRLTISIGLCTPLGSSLEAMIKSADEALYRAKLGGRNRVEVVR